MWVIIILWWCMSVDCIVIVSLVVSFVDVCIDMVEGQCFFMLMGVSGCLFLM